MEAKLKALVEAGNEENRAKAAREWKKQGRKVVGYLCSYVPEEIIHAAGMLPWRITGTWRHSVPLATGYMSVNSCSFCTHALESILTGELDFLDGMIATDSCETMLRLYDTIRHTEKLPFNHIISLPHYNSRLTRRMFAKSIADFTARLAELGGTEITDDALRQAIKTFNKTRTLLTRLYELRKGDAPPVTGRDCLGITLAATITPREDYNAELEALLGYLEQRQVTHSHPGPRLLVAGSILADPAYIGLMEDAGSLVVMDDLCTGSRYFWNQVDTSLDDPIQAIAERYLTAPPCARMYDQDRHLDQVIEWVKEYRADGVFHFPLMHCSSWLFSVPYFEHRLKEAHIPILSVPHEHHLSSVGQLQTRVGAFLEMLSTEEVI